MIESSLDIQGSGITTSHPTLVSAERGTKKSSGAHHEAPHLISTHTSHPKTRGQARAVSRSSELCIGILILACAVICSSSAPVFVSGKQSRIRGHEKVPYLHINRDIDHICRSYQDNAQSLNTPSRNRLFLTLTDFISVCKPSAQSSVLPVTNSDGVRKGKDAYPARRPEGSVAERYCNPPGIPPGNLWRPGKVSVSHFHRHL